MRISFFFRPLSLSFRLVSLISLTVIVAFLIFSSIMIYSVEKHFEELDAYNLKKINATITKILTNKNVPIDTAMERINEVVLEQGNIFVYVENEKKQLILVSDNSPDIDSIRSSLIKLPLANVYKSKVIAQEQDASELTHKHKMINYRVMVSPIDVYREKKPFVYTLIIAMPIDFHYHYIYELKSNLIIAAIIICFLIILMVLFIVYKGHAPLRAVSKKIAGITSENLNTRIEPKSVPIELRQLVTSFNVMLEKIEGVFKQQSHFSGDIAHEMRTPITNLMTQTQFILYHPRTVEEYKELLYSNLEEYDRMAKMVGDMLFLSQVDNNQLTAHLVQVNLRDEILKVFDFFEALAEEKGVFLRLEGDATSIFGDPAMLRRVINNLLSNAIRYTDKGKTINITLSEKEHNVFFVISNPGEQIASEHLPHLFDRFYRVDPSRQRKSEGSGIGLAIVKSIIEVHQGHVSVSSDAYTTCFRFCLPKKTDVISQ